MDQFSCWQTLYGRSRWQGEHNNDVWCVFLIEHMFVFLPLFVFVSPSVSINICWQVSLPLAPALAACGLKVNSPHCIRFLWVQVFLWFCDLIALLSVFLMIWIYIFIFQVPIISRNNWITIIMINQQIIIISDVHCSGADDLRPRSWNNRRNFGQAGVYSGLQGPT